MTCPSCGSLLAVTGRAHCHDNPTCRWVRCSCGDTVDTASDRHFGVAPPKEAK